MTTLLYKNIIQRPATQLAPVSSVKNPAIKHVRRHIAATLNDNTKGKSSRFKYPLSFMSRRHAIKRVISPLFSLLSPSVPQYPTRYSIVNVNPFHSQIICYHKNTMTQPVSFGFRLLCFLQNDFSLPPSTVSMLPPSITLFLSALILFCLALYQRCRPSTKRFCSSIKRVRLSFKYFRSITDFFHSFYQRFRPPLQYFHFRHQYFCPVM